MNVTTDINGLTDEIKTYISNLEEFHLQFKEYIYLNGLVDATTAIVKNWEVKENKLEIEFQLNDINNTTLKTIIDLKSDEIEIMEYNT